MIIFLFFLIGGLIFFFRYENFNMILVIIWKIFFLLYDLLAIGLYAYYSVYLFLKEMIIL